MISGDLHPIYPTWEMVSRMLALALLGAPMTYIIFYADKAVENWGAPFWEQAPLLLIIALCLLMGGLLVGGLAQPGLLYHATLWRVPINTGWVAAFLVFGHVAYGAVAFNVSVAFAVSNWAEMILAAFLVYTTAEAELERSHAEGQ